MASDPVDHASPGLTSDATPDRTSDPSTESASDATLDRAGGSTTDCASKVTGDSASDATIDRFRTTTSDTTTNNDPRSFAERRPWLTRDGRGATTTGRDRPPPDGRLGPTPRLAARGAAALAVFALVMGVGSLLTHLLAVLGGLPRPPGATARLPSTRVVSRIALAGYWVAAGTATAAVVAAVWHRPGVPP